MQVIQVLIRCVHVGLRSPLQVATGAVELSVHGRGSRTPGPRRKPDQHNNGMKGVPAYSHASPIIASHSLELRPDARRDVKVRFVVWLPTGRMRALCAHFSALLRQDAPRLTVATTVTTATTVAAGADSGAVVRGAA